MRHAPCLSCEMLIYHHSSVVANQVTDLLQEIHFFQRMGNSIQYFKTLHIYYIPLCKELLDTIETQVAKTTGALSDLGEGDTILTLHLHVTDPNLCRRKTAANS